MTRYSLAVVPLIVAALVGCGSPSPSTSAPTSAAVDTTFPKPFLEAGAWQDTEFVLAPAPQRWPSLDSALTEIRTYFLAGIRTQDADNGVAIVQMERIRRRRQ